MRTKRAGAEAPCFSERCIGDAYSMPARLEAALRVTDRSSVLGPLIRFDGSLVFCGLQASVIFSNGAHGTGDPHNGRVSRPVPLLPAGERITVSGQPLRGIHEPSSISIRLKDEAGRTLAEEREVGECVDGLQGIHVSFQLGAGALVWVAARGRTARGPRCAVTGEVVFPRGVVMRLAFHPDRRNGVGEGAAELLLLPAGMTWQASERIVEGGPSEESVVSIQFTEPGGRLLGAEHVVGRCGPI